jgi:hypothetical protein
MMRLFLVVVLILSNGNPPVLIESFRSIRGDGQGDELVVRGYRPWRSGSGRREILRAT